jgi:hypothetical protein
VEVRTLPLQPCLGFDERLGKKPRFGKRGFLFFEKPKKTIHSQDVCPIRRIV